MRKVFCCSRVVSNCGSDPPSESCSSGWAHHPDSFAYVHCRLSKLALLEEALSLCLESHAHRQHRCFPSRCVSRRQVVECPQIGGGIGGLTICFLFLHGFAISQDSPELSPSTSAAAASSDEAHLKFSAATGSVRFRYPMKYRLGLEHDWSEMEIPSDYRKTCHGHPLSGGTTMTTKSSSWSWTSSAEARWSIKNSIGVRSVSGGKSPKATSEDNKITTIFVKNGLRGLEVLPVGF